MSGTENYGPQDAAVSVGGDVDLGASVEPKTPDTQSESAAAAQGEPPRALTRCAALAAAVGGVAAIAAHAVGMARSGPASAWNGHGLMGVSNGSAKSGVYGTVRREGQSGVRGMAQAVAAVGVSGENPGAHTPRGPGRRRGRACRSR